MYSNLAVMLIVAELKNQSFFPALRAFTIDSFQLLFPPQKVSISVITGDRLLHNLWDAKSFPLVSTVYLTSVNRCVRHVSITVT